MKTGRFCSTFDRSRPMISDRVVLGTITVWSPRGPQRQAAPI
jgi:hypothetical protein